MLRIDDVIVHDGKATLTGLPYADGQRVQVLVSGPTSGTANGVRSIAQVRELLKGAVEGFDHPFEPMIPDDGWEMNK